MNGQTAPRIHLVTPEDIEAAERVERARQREARVDGLAIDRSRFAGDLLSQVSSQIASTFADEERVIAQRRARVTVSRLEAFRRLTAKPSLWRRVVWGER